MVSKSMFVFLIAGILAMGSKIMNEEQRIVFFPSSCKEKIQSLGFVELGKMKEGFWGGMDDDNYLAGLNKCPELTLIYLSKKDYEQAIKSLSGPDVDDVINKRIADWSPDLLSNGLGFLYSDEYRSLRWIAWCRKLSDKEQEKAFFDDLFEKTVTLIYKINMDGRYGADTKTGEMLKYVLIGESELIEEARAIIEDKYLNASSIVRQHINLSVSKWLDYSRELNRVSLAYNKEEITEERVNSLYHVGIGRVIFIKPLDQNILNALRSLHITHYKWNNGLVAYWDRNKISDLEQSGRSIKSIYITKYHFTSKIDEMTNAQLKMELERQLQKGITVSECIDFLARKQLHQILMKKKLLEKNMDEHVTLLLENQIKEEIGMLKNAMAFFIDESEKQPQTLEEAFKKVSKEEKNAEKDSWLFIELYKRAGQEEIAALGEFEGFRKIVQQKRNLISGFRK